MIISLFSISSLAKLISLKESGTLFENLYSTPAPLREQARDKYRNLSKEKNEKRKYGTYRYHNMSEEKKQKLKYEKITVRLKS